MNLDELEAKERTRELYKFYKKQLTEYGRSGLFGVARFSEVYDALMPVQQEKLSSICGDHFKEMYSEGSIISIAVAYDEDVISTINTKSDQGLDIENWNIYASEYENINSILNAIAGRLAEEIDGIAIPATWETQERKQYHYVREAFGATVSHRAIAEIAGLGWRGKNGLVINEKHSCAIRFASIIAPFILDYSRRSTLDCGDCTACENACSFIRNRSLLSDYRDYCRRYIDYLRSKGMKYDVCGKCIKACYFDSIYAKQFQL